MEEVLQIPEVDAEGYLTDPSAWSETLAIEFARQESIQLTDEHWDVISFMREYYDKHQVIPDVRFAIKHLAARLGKESRNRIFELFPYGYVKQEYRIAGMRRPRAWSTG